MRYYWTYRMIVYILLSREASPQNTYFDEKVTIVESANISNEYFANINKALNRGPYFDTSATKNVTSLVGKTGHLNCRIKNLGNKTVSWIRHRDLHLLTVSESTYTSDQRFTSIYNKQTGDWSLQIMFAQIRDSGIYECQVSTTPPVGYTMIFSVVEPITSIPGGPELYIDLGSTVNLTCVVKHLPDPPLTVHWTHNNQDINYDSPRGGVSVITEKGDITTSYLLIQRAKLSDSGKYSCLPSNANPKSVNVHILIGDHPAAVQKGDRLVPYSCFLIILIIFAFI
ncbi:protein CEPU-1 [Drosophila pseudoobscura]|uniref:Protein CEPU-1 n=1 Tax=Drosophila pseudoobscura pseudoobscura TaxID=46245 RepID=A0A6I8VMD0_DROPS|nr:protein CEPU-1 [Drosophila pseudoobscura]